MADTPGGLPVGGTWKEHPSVQLGAPRLSCLPQAWAAPAPGSGLTPSLWVGKSSEDPHVQLLFWVPMGTSKLPHSPLSAAQQILEEVSLSRQCEVKPVSPRCHPRRQMERVGQR